MPLKKEMTRQTSTSDLWFDDFIATLRTDQLLLDSNLISNEKKNFYEAVINNDLDKVMQQTTNAAMQYFTINILKHYVSIVNSLNVKPLLLGVCTVNREILIWSEINDDDDNTESLLFIAEAKVNAAFHQSGVYLNTTIVEKSDKIKMPNQYKLLYQNA